MPIRPTYLHVTETALICSALPDLAPDLAEAIVEWLHAHGLDENHVHAGSPIVRRPNDHELSWTSVHWAAYRGHLIPMTAQAPADAVGEWPAPFPQILLDQQQPPSCLACGRPYDDQEAGQ